jgi:hypothetical protein
MHYCAVINTPIVVGIKATGRWKTTFGSRRPTEAATGISIGAQ